MRIEVDVKMQKCKASRQFQSWYSVNGPNLTVSSRRKGRRFREESRREGTRGSARKESMNPPRVYFMMGDVTWVEREGMTNRRTIKEWLTRSKFHFASLGEGQLVLFTWIQLLGAGQLVFLFTWIQLLVKGQVFLFVPQHQGRHVVTVPLNRGKQEDHYLCIRFTCLVH